MTIKTRFRIYFNMFMNNLKTKKLKNLKKLAKEQGYYLAKYNEDGEFGQSTGWLINMGSENISAWYPVSDCKISK